MIGSFCASSQVVMRGQDFFRVGLPTWKSESVQQ